LSLITIFAPFRGPCSIYSSWQGIKTREEIDIMQNEKLLRQQLVKLLNSSEAHADFEAAIKDLPVNLRGKRPEGAEHSPWELLEHLRIAQWDILDFSVNPKYKAMEWPKDYWPKSQAPASEIAWDNSVKSFRTDLKNFCDLVAAESTDLFAKIPHGDGQTILREALLAADHNAYHIGQLVLVRKLLGAWK
jgi:hypothetical protein